MKNKKYPKNRRSNKRIFKYFALAIGAAVAILTVLELTNTIDLIHHEKMAPPSTSIGQTTKGEPKSDNETSNDNSDDGAVSPGDSGKRISDGPTANIKLLTPSGNFVSNHHPNLDGSPAPNIMQSVCTTSPGASCYISFTKNGIIKSLPKQSTDAEGATYWSWKLQDIGLSKGVWQIKAVATYNNQTKTAYDAMNLEVGP